MKKLLNGIIEHNFKWGKYFLAFSALLTLAGTLSLHRIETDFSDRPWFQKDDPYILYLDEFLQTFGNDESAIAIIHFKRGVFHQQSIRVLREITEQMWKVHNVIRVDSLANYHWSYGQGNDMITEKFIPESATLSDAFLATKREQALNHRVIPGLYLNPEGTVAVVYGHLSLLGESEADTEKIVDDLEKLIGPYQGRDDLALHLLGSSIIKHEFKKATLQDLRLVLPLMAIIVVLFLLFYFKTILGVAIPLAVIVASTVSGLAMVPLFGFTLNSLTFMLPGIILSISIADSIHLLVTFYKEYRDDRSREEALRQSLTKNILPLIFTSLTTSIGFFSLASSDIRPIAELGILAGVSSFVALLHSYFIVIPALSIFRCRPSEEFNSRNLNQFLALKMVSLLDRHKKLILSVFSVITLTTIYWAFQNEINVSVYRYFDQQSPLSKANRFVRKNLGGVMGPEIVLDSGREDGVKQPEFLRKLEEFQNWLESLPKITKTVSIVNIIKEVHQSLNGGGAEQYRIADSAELIGQEIFVYEMELPPGMGINSRIDLKARKARLNVKWEVHNSREVALYLEKIEAKLKEMGLEGRVTGKNVLFSRINEYIIETYLLSIGIAVTLITLLFIIIFRSFKAGLLSLIPNIIPLIIGTGLLWPLGISIDTGCVIVVSVTLGIAVDDTIHFLSHYFYSRGKKQSIKDSLLYVFSGSALSLILTTVLLVSCFSMFMFSSLGPNKNFGLISTVILSFALLCDLIFLPSILLYFNQFKLGGLYGKGHRLE